jgi:hypothetical protein
MKQQTKNSHQSNQLEEECKDTDEVDRIKGMSFIMNSDL